MRKWPLVTFAALALAGCSNMPVAGPSVGEIESVRQAERAPDGIELFDLDKATVDTVASFRTPPLAGRFTDKRPSPVQTIGVGDTINVAIFEAAANGLFSGSVGVGGAASKATPLPPQPVGPSGTITIPYAGQVQVAGKSPQQVEQSIVEKLRDKAIEPQAVVTVQTVRSTLVTVDGDVGTAGRVPLSPRGDRLMDVIAGAGGTKGVASELFVRLTRGNVTGTVPIRTILEDPRENIWAHPGDQIFVYREPQSFTALGATERSGNFTFEYDRMTLVQAIGAAAGLNDDKAEPAGVFVYRQERGAVVCAIKGERPCAAPETMRPVIYRLNLRVAEGIPLAQRVLVRNRDVVYVANAEGAEVSKVMRLVSATATTVSSSASISQKIHNW